MALVTPYMENGSLYDVLVNPRAPSHRGVRLIINIYIYIYMCVCVCVCVYKYIDAYHTTYASHNIIYIYIHDITFYSSLSLKIPQFSPPKNRLPWSR